MKARFFLLAGSIFLSFYGCNYSGKSIDKSQQTDTSGYVKKVNDSLADDEIRKTLKGASIYDTVKSIKLYYFSTSISADTFELIIPPGLIANTKATFLIKASDNRVIYTESFNNYFFVKGIFEPDTIPTGGQEVYDKYIHDYIISLTKKQFEDYTKKSIDSFFKYISLDSNFSKEQHEEEEIVNKSLYSQVMNDSSLKVIFLPCFDCDEGESALAYSSKEGKVLPITAFD